MTSKISTPSSNRNIFQDMLHSPLIQEVLGLMIMLAIIIFVMVQLSAVFLTTRNFNTLLLARSTIGIIAVLRFVESGELATVGKESREDADADA